MREIPDGALQGDENQVALHRKMMANIIEKVRLHSPFAKGTLASIQSKNMFMHCCWYGASLCCPVMDCLSLGDHWKKSADPHTPRNTNQHPTHDQGETSVDDRMACWTVFSY